MGKGHRLRRLSACLFLTLFLLSACGEKDTEPAETDWTAEQIVSAIAAEQAGLEAPHWLPFGGEDFDTYLEVVYQIPLELVEDGAIAAAGGTEASEIAVLVLRDEEGAETARRALEAYRSAREGDFTGYVPEEAAIVAGSRVTVQGRYAALLLCADPETAQETFLRAFGGTPPPETPDGGEELPPADEPPVDDPPADQPPTGGLTVEEPPADDPPANDPPVEPEVQQPDPPPVQIPDPKPAEDVYDGSAVLSAWRSGDRSALWGKNLAVLEGCADVIGQVISDDMTDYEKELAIHDWMIAWAEYDPGELNVFQTPDPDNDTPYGFLYSRVGICLGYARTFQLFMDMLDIECVTVRGYAHNGLEEHAWNMVRLDGEWYCVDVTWDDPVSSFPVPAYLAHYYFNVTSEHLRDNDHQWDEDAVEEAEGTQYAWQGWR